MAKLLFRHNFIQISRIKWDPWSLGVKSKVLYSPWALEGVTFTSSGSSMGVESSTNHRVSQYSNCCWINYILSSVQLDDVYRRCQLINGNKSVVGRLFSLAHRVGWSFGRLANINNLDESVSKTTDCHVEDDLVSLSAVFVTVNFGGGGCSALGSFCWSYGGGLPLICKLWSPDCVCVLMK